MENNRHSPALHRFAIVVALSSLGLIGIGGLVTSHGVGMAVPDWPTSYGYNMFTLPFSIWLTGGVFHEHTHRQWASIVGVLVVLLTRWLGGTPARRPLIVIGAIEILGGFGMLLLGDEWSGGGHFLSGIGLVVLLAGAIWFRNEPAPKPLPAMGWWAFWLVQLQGLLGGLRVVLNAHVFAGAKMGVVFGIFHGCLAQAFIVLLCAVVLLTSRWWRNVATQLSHIKIRLPTALFLFTTVLIGCQLILGATMRHQHAGLAIPDFPKAYGSWWPDMSATAVARYNAERVEVSAENPITAFQIELQMVHRLMAAAILVCVTACVCRTHHKLIRKFCGIWLALVLIQAGLGMWTIWSNKAADIATLHVLCGALTLVAGSLIAIIGIRFNFLCCSGGQFLASDAALNGPWRPLDANQIESAR
jgi:cytochrome c oxidase assembly protein subunit 15